MRDVLGPTFRRADSFFTRALFLAASTFLAAPTFAFDCVFVRVGVDAPVEPDEREEPEYDEPDDDEREYEEPDDAPEYDGDPLEDDCVALEPLLRVTAAEGFGAAGWVAAGAGSGAGSGVGPAADAEAQNAAGTIAATSSARATPSRDALQRHPLASRAIP